jgi:hypothetical protein
MGGGGGGAILAWPATAVSPYITMDIHISNQTHKFQNKTGLDAKANSELYKSKQVNSVDFFLFSGFNRFMHFLSTHANS